MEDVKRKRKPKAEIVREIEAIQYLPTDEIMRRVGVSYETVRHVRNMLGHPRFDRHGLRAAIESKEGLYEWVCKTCPESLSIEDYLALIAVDAMLDDYDQRSDKE